jgi:hypothetical protein
MSTTESQALATSTEWGIITPGLPKGLVFDPVNGNLEFTAVYFTRIGDLVTVTGSFSLRNGSIRDGSSIWSTTISNFPYSPPFPDNTFVAPGSVTWNQFARPIVGAWIFYSSTKTVNLSIYSTPGGMSGSVMFSFVYSISGTGLPPGSAQAAFSEPVQD